MMGKNTISHREIEILEILKQTTEPLRIYHIIKLLYSDEKKRRKLMNKYGYIQKTLKKLVDKGFIERINSKPVFYKILKPNSRLPVNFRIKVECPKCKEIYIIEEDQQTKQCFNCKTPTGKSTRFWITNNRIVSYIIDGEERIVSLPQEKIEEIPEVFF